MNLGQQKLVSLGERVVFDEETLKWQIASLRRDISADWVALAKKTLDPDKRKAIRDHLEMSDCALRAATEQLDAGLRRGGETGDRVVKIDMNNLARQIIRPSDRAPTHNRE